MFEVNINLSSIQLPKLVKKEKELPSFETVFGIVKGTEIELPCLLSSWLSLRVGEVVGLQFRDVDTEKKTLKIRRTIIQTVDGQEVREGCKTEKSTRSLNIYSAERKYINAVPHEKSHGLSHESLKRRYIHKNIWFRYRFKSCLRNHVNKPFDDSQTACSFARMTHMGIGVELMIIIIGTI